MHQELPPPSYDVTFASVAAPATEGATWGAAGLEISLVEGREYSTAQINELISKAGGTAPPADAIGLNVNFAGTITAPAPTAGTPTAVTYVAKPFFENTTSGEVRLTQAFTDDPASYITRSKTAGAGANDSDNLIAMGKIFDTPLEFGMAGNPPAPVYKGKPNEFINYYNLTLGQEKSYYSGLVKVSASVTNELITRRNNVSAVSQEEEGINLMTYNKAFAAASRIMTALDEALDMVINRMGTVGR